jgi:hypothetical protein
MVGLSGTPFTYISNAKKNLFTHVRALGRKNTKTWIQTKERGEKEINKKESKRNVSPWLRKPNVTGSTMASPTLSAAH